MPPTGKRLPLVDRKPPDAVPRAGVRKVPWRKALAVGGLRPGGGGTPSLDLRMGTSLEDADVGPRRAPTPLPSSSAGVPSSGLRWTKRPCQRLLPWGQRGRRPSPALGAGFVIVCHQGGSEAPYLCVTHWCLSAYGRHTPATALGSHQHPRHGTQRGEGGADRSLGWAWSS